MDIDQIASNPPPSVKRTNVEKSAPNHPGKPYTPPLTGDAHILQMCLMHTFTNIKLTLMICRGKLLFLCEIFLIVSNKFLFQLRDRILLAVSIHSYGKDIYYPKVFKAIIVHTICICCAIIIFAIQMKKKIIITWHCQVGSDT